MMPDKKTHTPPGGVGLILCASCVVHITLLWTLVKLPAHPSNQPISPEGMMSSVRMLDESALPEAMRRATSQDKKKEKKKREPPKPKPDDMLPYVTQDTLIKAQQPDQARFSGKKAQRTERDTQRKAKPGAAPRNQPLASRIIKGKPSGIDDPKPRQQPSDAPPKTSKNSREELESRDTPPDVILPGGPIAEQATEVLDEDMGTDKIERQSFSPTITFDKGFGDKGTLLRASDVHEEEPTGCCQQPHGHCHFWDRLVRQVTAEWDPGEVYRQRDPYGNIYGHRHFYTRMAVTLNSDGSINRLRVMVSSTAHFVDDEAVRALLDAGPYPAPPEGMKDEDGLVHVKLGFSLEISAGEVSLFHITPEGLL